MDNQVLDWLYEYCVKQDYSHLCSSIEAEFKKRGRHPSIPKCGFLLFIRRLQIILHGEKIITKINLEALVRLLHDILLYEPFQKCLNFHKSVIKLLMVTKLWLVDEEGLHHETVMKHLPYFNWDSLKFRFRYQIGELVDGANKAALINFLQDDYFKEHYAKFIQAAHEALEACTDKQTNSTEHLKPRLRKVMECTLHVDLPKLKASLMMLVPTTALEKLINNEELRETFTREGSPEFQILLKFISEDITESVIRKVMQALMTLHATVSENPQTSNEFRTAKNVNTSLEKTEQDELREACVHGKDISVNRKVERTASRMSHSDREELVIVNGEIKYMEKSIEFPQSVCRESRHEKKKKCSAAHTSTDGLCDPDLVTSQMPVSPDDVYVLIHNSKKFEVVSKVVPVPVKIPKSSKHSKTFHAQMENCMEDSEIQGLEKMVKTLEIFLSILKAKLKQEKGRRAAAAGLQRFSDEHSNSSDEDHLDNCHADTNVASLKQQPTHQSSQVNDDHQTQNSSTLTNKNHNPLDLHCQNSASKISPSEKSLIAVVSDSHDFEREMKTSPLKSTQNENQRKENSFLGFTPPSSLTRQMSHCIPHRASRHGQNALRLYLSDSSDTSSEREETISYQEEIKETLRNNKENKRPLQLASHSQNYGIAKSSIPPEAHSSPNLNSECLHIGTSQECVGSSTKQNAICDSVLPSKVCKISSSRIKQVVDETRTYKGLKQYVLHGRKRTRTYIRMLKEENAEGKNIQISNYSDDLPGKTKTKSHSSVSKALEKDEIHGTKQPLRLKSKKLEQESEQVVSPISVQGADSLQSDNDTFLTPMYSPLPGLQFSPFCSTTDDDNSDAESWVSAQNNTVLPQDIKAKKT